MSDGFKLLHEHREDCFARDDECCFTITDRRYPIDWRRKKNGDRGGSTMWWRFVCNDLSCDAVMLVRWDIVSRFVTSRGADRG